MRTGVFAPGSEPDILTFHAARELLPSGLARAIVRESRLATLPGVRQRGHDPGRWRWLLPAMPYWFRRLDLSAYDVVVSSSHAFAVQARPRPGALHVCYCYTPLRYVWLPGTDPRSSRRLQDVPLRALRGMLRRLDLEASARPHGYAAISSAVAERVKRFYGREAVVIHPPVDVEGFDPAAEKEPGRFLWVHRLVEYKRPELVAEAFRELPYNLTMVGVGPLEARLRRSLPPNVELLGWVSQAELAALMARACGFIHVGEEDFGITMVEALASGTPVVALARGGARDVVRDGVDGVLLQQAELGALRAAVRRVAEERWDARELSAGARRFSREVFVRRMREYLASF